jgi:hypothetical protein
MAQLLQDAERISVVYDGVTQVDPSVVIFRRQGEIAQMFAVLMFDSHLITFDVLAIDFEPSQFGFLENKEFVLSELLVSKLVPGRLDEGLESWRRWWWCVDSAHCCQLSSTSSSSG